MASGRLQNWRRAALSHFGWAAACFCPALAACAGQDARTAPVTVQQPAEPLTFDREGYRIARYQAPVDRPPSPAKRISLGDALRLRPAREALFIDVLPAESGFRDSATGVWRLAQPHETIPGAEWHPEAGRGVPDPVLWRGLERAVARARVKRPELPVVLFCRTDCWMGWNAARRLARASGGRVFWFAEGVEGWQAAGRALATVAPQVTAP